MNIISLNKIVILVVAFVAIFMLYSMNNTNQIIKSESSTITNKTEQKVLAPTLKTSHRQMADTETAQVNRINTIANSKVDGEQSQHTEPSLSIKNIQSNSLSDQKDQLSSALSSIPINYHSMFQWEKGHDQELVEAFMSVTQLNELDELQQENEKLNGVNLEELISDYIYQHEFVEQIQIESLNCNNFSCVMYGVELQSGIWNMITEGVKSQQWGEFSQETTRSSVDQNGNLTFLTIIKR